MEGDQKLEEAKQGELLVTDRARNEFFLTEKQLAIRWQTSLKKLQKDRLHGTGVQWVRIGRLVRYRLSDIIAWERDNTRQNTSEA